MRIISYIVKGSPWVARRGVERIKVSRMELTFGAVVIGIFALVGVALLVLILVAAFGDKWEARKRRIHIEQRDALKARADKVEKEARELGYHQEIEETEPYRKLMFEAQSLLRDSRRELSKPTRVIEGAEAEFEKLKASGKDYRKKK